MSRFYLLIIFSTIVNNVCAQVTDNFSDGNFNSSPAWSGDSADFNVNSSSQLQLNATAAGTSSLAVQAALTSLDSVEWRFFIHLDFSPSSSNYSRVYLSSDNSDVSQPCNGYFLQFGESLSDDAIELFRQDGTNITSVLRGTNGKIANAFSAGIKVTRTLSGSWELYADYSGGNNYAIEATGNDIVYNTSQFIAVNCIYTSGNIDGFYFDDFYAGPFIGDTIKPYINSVNAINDSVVSVLFSEEMDANSLITFSDYEIDGNIGNPILISPDSQNTLQYFLEFNSHFQPGTNYSLIVNGLTDLAGNNLSDSVNSFIYYPEKIAARNDIVISEFYFDPSEESPLPNSEFVEIFNRSDSAIKISGWTISDGTTVGAISEAILFPHSYYVLYSDNNSSVFNSIDNRIPVESFPALNNDGDQIILADSNENIIDQLRYTDQLYYDGNKSSGGWAIERIDNDFTCNDDRNWKASVSVHHGTPGTQNSISGIFLDNESPYILNAVISGSTELKIIFSESIYAGLNEISNYQVKDENGNIFFPASINTTGDSTWLQFNSPFTKGIYSLSVSYSLHDCAGNSFRKNHSVQFGIPDTANAGDLIINELLFNPYDGGNDFVELYNPSAKIIDLKGWTIAETDHEDISDIKEIAIISEEDLLILPGQFLVLSENKNNVDRFYYCADEYSFQDVKNMPDFSSDDGSLLIHDNYGNQQCVFSYSDDMHFALLNDTRGVSLERLSFDSDDKTNWHSAAAIAGFATPGYKNSQQTLEGTEENISLEQTVFSPDNDGYNDILTMHYNFPDPGIILTINIYDYNGQQVRSILQGESVGNSGTLFWDGLTNDRLIAAEGIYILMAKTFDLRGKSLCFKKAIFLATK